MEKPVQTSDLDTMQPLDSIPLGLPQLPGHIARREELTTYHSRRIGRIAPGLGPKTPSGAGDAVGNNVISFRFQSSAFSNKVPSPTKGPQKPRETTGGEPWHTWAQTHLLIYKRLPWRKPRQNMSLCVAGTRRYYPMVRATVA
ncbi:Hypothetical predicted protein [Pelobates cultripes]|uniref:Uncharacterized protein n=1 Tax=Pelobates cultripes TaxID=61616 RepID=A0AAD1SGA7_PELCU|nr:Hypothetical predicted protein [Pelobates cultripes]